MVLGEDEKLIRVKSDVHRKLEDLRQFPDKTTFSDVIAWLIEEQQNREEAKELVE